MQKAPWVAERRPVKLFNQDVSAYVCGKTPLDRCVFHMLYSRCVSFVFVFLVLDLDRDASVEDLGTLQCISAWLFTY